VIVRVFPADTHGCAYYRLEEPGRAVGLEGHEVYSYRGDVALPPRSHPQVLCSVEHEDGGHRLNELVQDVVVLNRPAKRSWLQFIPALQHRGCAVVVDIDDDIHAMHPKDEARAEFSPEVNPEMNWDHLMTACKKADLVTCPTQALADRYAPHGRYAILPNCVPEAMLTMPRASDGHTVGWGGDIKKHRDDLERTGGGVAAAIAEVPGWHFGLLGDLPWAVAQALKLERPPTRTGWMSIPDWQLALGTLDVGIVPLADSEFNQGKSYLKGIEYAARGVPFVASPSPAYQALAALGIGTLAETPAEWQRELRSLMAHDARRIEIAMGARDVVAANHTYEGQAWRWTEAWTEAITQRKRCYGARV
jgi:Glycosyl transferases group 1